MINLLLFLLCLFFLAIVPNLGFFTLSSIFIIIFSTVCFVLIFVYKKYFNNFSNKNWQYILFILLFYSAFNYGGLYQDKTSILLGSLVFLIFVCYQFIIFLLNKKQSLLIILAVFFFLGWITIYFSPHPRVDTLVVLTEAPLKFLQGKNPYAENFTQVYSNVTPNYYNYLPFSFIALVPLLILPDIRFGFLIIMILSALVFNKLLKNRNNNDNYLFISLMLFAPRSFFMLEHAYLDLIIFLPFLLFLFFFYKKKSLAFLFLGIFLSFKQNILFLFPFFLNKQFLFNENYKKNTILLLLPFIPVVYYLFVDRFAFIKDVFINLLPKEITSPISSSLTITTLIKYLGTQSNYIGLILVIVLAISVLILLIKKMHFFVIFNLIVSLLLFHLLTYHAFYNNYYFICQLLILFIALKNNGHSKIKKLFLNDE